MDIQTKHRIYELLTGAFSMGEAYPLSRIAKFLTDADIRSAAYGYPKMRALLEDLPEFLTVTPIMLGQNPQQMITLHTWTDDAPNDRSSPEENFFRLVNVPAKSLAVFCNLMGLTEPEARAALEQGYKRAKSEGSLQSEGDNLAYDVGPAHIVLQKSWYAESSQPWHFSFHMQEVPARPAITNTAQAPIQRQHTAKADEHRFTEAERQEIYHVLTGQLPTGEKLHMAAVSKQLADNGYPKERYGFAKMKAFLLALGDMLTLEDQVMGGVPQSLVTIHPQAHWEQPSASQPAAHVGGSEEPPQRMDEAVFLAPKTLAILNAYLTGQEAPPAPAVIDQLRAAYEKARLEGNLEYRNDAYRFPLPFKGLEGGALFAAIKRSNSDYAGASPWYLNFAGPDRFGRAPGKMLEQFAFLGTWSSFLEGLAQKALPEPWDFGEGSHKRYHILQKYIQYTFYRLQLEDKVCIAEDKSFAAFNTGLVTPHYDDLYACFEPNDEGAATAWHFVDFCTAAGRGVGKRLVDAFNPLPQPASYFERKEDLLFDLEKELHTDFDHILLDNVSRLPLPFLQEESRGIPAAQSMLEQIQSTDEAAAKRTLYSELSGVIADTPRLYNRLRNRVEDAIELAKKQVRWNFKTAIPCYFPTRNVMSLMLPLSLQYDGRADAALVVELTRSGNYQGQTILTLQQAYLDARLLCRPNSEWLNTEAQGGDALDEEEA